MIINDRSLAPKSLSAFLSAQLPSTFNKQPSQLIEAVSPLPGHMGRYNGMNGDMPSLQTTLFGTDTAHATGIGKLGDETNGQIDRLEHFWKMIVYVLKLKNKSLDLFRISDCQL